MQLPVRLQREPGDEPVLSVDGAFDAPGLNLSHWPGNRTPQELAHALSTGSALAFSRLTPERREELAAGCTAIVNNHVDTDGVCATLALCEPEAARAREEALLDAARAGDYFSPPTEAAFIVDSIVMGFLDAERSPLAEAFSGLSDDERHELAYLEALRRLPAILDGEIAPFAALFEAPLAAYRADLGDLARVRRDELVHLELTIWTASTGTRSSRVGGEHAFDPGRHALFGSAHTDRALIVGARDEGATYRLVINTSSWFEQPGVELSPRPDLIALAGALNEREGRSAADEIRWYAQSASNPAPELWFGHAREASFKEHAPNLRPSRLEPELVVRGVVDALRSVWAFPE